MEREYFTVKLHAAGMDTSMRIVLETRFAQCIEEFLGGHEAALQVCKRAAERSDGDSDWKKACARATGTMRLEHKLPLDARFSICLSQVMDL